MRTFLTLRRCFALLSWQLTIHNADAGSPNGDDQSPTPVVGSDFGHKATFKLPLQSDFGPYDPTIVIGGSGGKTDHLLTKFINTKVFNR